jgi:uncharacterized membrane protein
LTLNILFLSALFCLLPISELRGGLPFALSSGIPPIPAFLFCVSLNALVGPLVYLFLNTLHRLLTPIKIYKRLFDRFVIRARSRLKEKVERFGYWGIVLFVGIPLPVTGAYTGALGAWILGMEPKKTVPFIGLGVILSGIIVTVVYYLVSTLGLEFLKIFIKEL